MVNIDIEVTERGVPCLAYRSMRASRTLGQELHRSATATTIDTAWGFVLQSTFGGQ
jgi:hypothetical protein